MTVLEETRSIAELVQSKDQVVLSRVSWQTYGSLLDQIEGRRLRHTYEHGRLEFMTRSSEHEIYKSLLGMFVVVIADEFDLPLHMGGEVTLRREDLEQGIEPDQCYWIANESKVRGKKQLDLSSDPPPDLFLEIEVSRSLLDRLAVAASLHVGEVWRFDGTNLSIGILQSDGQYHWQSDSAVFPMVPVQEISRFLLMTDQCDHLTILRAFRQWTRDHKPARQ